MPLNFLRRIEKAGMHVNRKLRETIYKDEVTRREQIAFLGLANKLIFNEPFKLLVTKESAKYVSTLIQLDFAKTIQESLTGVDEIPEEVSTVTESIMEHETFDHIDMIPSVLLEEVDMTPMEVTVTPHEEDLRIVPEYTGWGFTPKLSKENKVNDMATVNCLGVAILNGIDFKQSGHKPVMLVGIDHSEAVLLNGPQISIDQLIRRDGYKLLRGITLHSEGVKRTKEKIYLAFDFNDAVLYEILENLEVLRHISLGKKVYVLPGALKLGQEIAKKYARYLQATDWSVLQKKLFPDIAKAFEENRDEIEKAKEDQRTRRLNELAQTVFRRALDKNYKDTEYGNLNFEQAQQHLINTSKLFSEQVLSYIYRDIPFDNSVPSYIKSAYAQVKTEIDEADIEEDNKQSVRAIIYLMIMSNVLEYSELRKRIAMTES